MSPSPQELFKRAAWLHLERSVYQYLFANSQGRLDGALKAHTHSALCRFYIAVYLNCSEDDAMRLHMDAYRNLHRATQESLTDYLDEVIGFPLEGLPDYDMLAPKFFEVFHNLAIQSLES